MKKFMRLAMVLALAGATLLYSGCTKDYQKDIDDLNTDVTTLKNTVQALQNQVSALEELRSKVSELEKADKDLKTLIDACNAEIKKIQDGYATKDELESGLAALKNEITETLNGLAADVKDNTEAIAALQEAYEAVGDFTEALNSDKIASVVLVPSAVLYEPVVNYGFQLSKEGRVYHGPFISRYWWEYVWENREIIDAANVVDVAQLYLQYTVRPASLAAKLNSDNTTLHILWDKDYYVPVRFLDADDESGNVFFVADIDSEVFPSDIFTPDVAFPFSLEIDDVAESGVMNSITSPFNFAIMPEEYDVLEYAAYNEETLKKAATIPGYEVPWNEYATSQRTFFEGYAVGLNVPNFGVLPLETAAYLLNVELADITPELEISIENTETDFIKTDAKAWTAQMKATKDADAKTAIGKSVKATENAYFVNDFRKYDVFKIAQTYTVVEAIDKAVEIETRNITWTGQDGAIASGLVDVNIPISEALNEDSIDLIAMGKYADGTPYTYYATASKDGKLVEVTLTSEIPFASEAQTFTFVGYDKAKADGSVLNLVTFTLTLDPMPADKVLDLGVFTIDGSYTEDIKVSLDGIVKGLVDGDEDLYANFAKSPLYGTIAGLFNGANEIYKIGVQKIDGTVEKYEGAEGYPTYEGRKPVTEVYKDFGISYEDNAKLQTYGDNSSLTLKAGKALYGATYTFYGTTTAYDVDYDYTFQIVINEPDFALVTTPYVGEGNVIEVLAEIENNKYTIKDVDFSHYFELNKAVAVEELYVCFQFDYETWKDASGDPHYYDGVAKLGEIEVTKDDEPKSYYITIDGTTKKLATSVLDWNTYVGRQIYGKATLKAKKAGDTYETIGKAIEFTLVTPDPIKTFEAAPVTAERVSGKLTPINLRKALTITSQIENILIKDRRDLVWPDDYKSMFELAVHTWDMYDIKLNYQNKDSGQLVWGTDAPETLEGTINGVAHTFAIKTDYTISDGQLEFKADNAPGDVTLIVPVAISHKLNYGEFEHVANIEVTIPHHSQDAPATE